MLKEFRKSEHGGITALAIFLVLMIFVLIGISVDVSNAYKVRTQLQIAADALESRLAVSADTLYEVRQFLVERLRHHALESGATARQLSGVLAAPLSTLPDFQARLDAVRGFMQQRWDQQHSRRLQ